MNEIWTDIKGFEGYQISNLGRVKSLKSGFERILKPGIGKPAYRHVCIQENGRRKTVRIHRLVAQYFLPNPHNKPEVNHKNGNKLDNRLENLEWVTASENSLHAVNTGLSPKQGCGHHFAKLTESDIIEIRQLAKHKTHHVIAEMFGVSRSSITNICNKKHWSHI